MSKDKTIWFCAGTAGELIKLYPIILLVSSDPELQWGFLFTGQSPINFWKQWDDFKLPRAFVVTLLNMQHDLSTSGQALKWFAKAFLLSKPAIKALVEGAGLPPPKQRDAIIIHGDTLSTLVGSIYARRLNIGTIAHVEAGLRSESLLKPFPEEITRRIVSRIANLHFPQDEMAKRNLEMVGVKGEIVCTFGNTLYDALTNVEKNFPLILLPQQPFVVANIHRFENLRSEKNWKIIIETLCAAAKKQPVYLVQHPPTQQKIDSNQEIKNQLKMAGVRLLPRQPFTSFIQLIHGASYVISDGGSNQEECAYLGKPCLILRDTTERVEGLSDGPCLLTKFNQNLIDQFLEEPPKWDKSNQHLKQSPSSIIMGKICIKMQC